MWMDDTTKRTLRMLCARALVDETGEVWGWVTGQDWSGMVRCYSRKRGSDPLRLTVDWTGFVCTPDIADDVTRACGLVYAPVF